MLFIRDAVFNGLHSNDLQRGINIDEILSSSNLVFEKPSSASKALSPLRFAVTIRTEYSNLVVVQETDVRSTMPYFVRLEEGNIEHTGYDLINYENAMAILNDVVDVGVGEERDNFNGLMFSKTVPQVIGLYYPNLSKGNPYFYSHIILKDDAVDEFAKYLKEGVRFVQINDLDPKGNTPAFYNSIFNI